MDTSWIKTNEEKQAIRVETIKKLKEIKKQAYSGLTAIEYDSINALIHFLELMKKENENYGKQ